MSSSLKKPTIQQKITLVGFRAHSVLMEPSTEDIANVTPKFELELSNSVFEDNENHFIKIFKINLVHPIIEFEDTFQVQIEFHAIFESSMKITSDFLNSSFVEVSAPAIGFPYLRSFVTLLATNSGFPPIFLPSVNFIEFAKNQANNKVEN